MGAARLTVHLPGLLANLRHRFILEIGLIELWFNPCLSGAAPSVVGARILEAQLQ